MEPTTPTPERTGHLTLNEARARVAERLAGLTRNRIAGRIRDEDFAEVDRSLDDLGKMIDATVAEVDRARQSVKDAQEMLDLLRLC
jgi:hypothetical protein